MEGHRPCPRRYRAPRHSHAPAAGFPEPARSACTAHVLLTRPHRYHTVAERVTAWFSDTVAIWMNTVTCCHLAR